MPQGSWAAAVKKKPSGGATSNNSPAPTASVQSATSSGDASTAVADDSVETGATRRSSKSITIIDPVAEGLIEHNSFGHYRPPTPVAPPLSPCTAREVATVSQGTTSEGVRCKYVIFNRKQILAHRLALRCL